MTRFPDPNDNRIKFMLLNPAVHFEEIVNEARAVFLAGGTMEPISHFVQQLFSHLPAEQIRTISTDHVLPKENLIALTLAAGPTGQKFEFTFKKRNNPILLRDLGTSVANICNIIPDGVVIFFQSFNFLQTVISRWKEDGTMDRILRKKVVFSEPRETNQVEFVLENFTKQIRMKEDPRGSLLFCVVGAKMSEGINFKDELARGIIMVGLPFANPTAVDLKERMSYLDREQGQGAGQVYYMNLCMRAVNQSIGRAIRHIGDYSSIVLLDHRYQRNQIASQIPKWIQKSLVHAPKFGTVIRHLAQFFRRMRNK